MSQRDIKVGDFCIVNPNSKMNYKNQKGKLCQIIEVSGSRDYIFRWFRTDFPGCAGVWPRDVIKLNLTELDKIILGYK